MIGVDSGPSCVDIGKEAAGSLPQRADKGIKALALTGMSTTCLLYTSDAADE